MNDNGFAHIAGEIIVGVVIAVIAWLRKQRVDTRINENERLAVAAKDLAETNWLYEMRRAELEAMDRKLLSDNGEPTPAARQIYATIVADLQLLYAGIGKQVSREAFCIEVEKRWGEWLFENVCKPLNVRRGGCLIVAAALAKGDSVWVVSPSVAQAQKIVTDRLTGKAGDGPTLPCLFALASGR